MICAKCPDGEYEVEREEAGVKYLRCKNCGTGALLGNPNSLMAAGHTINWRNVRILDSNTEEP